MILREFKGQLEILPAYGDVFKNVISKDDTRYFLQAIYFNEDDKTFTATDGRQLFIYQCVGNELDLIRDFESGYFEVVKSAKGTKLVPFELDGTFPQISRITTCERESYNAENVNGASLPNCFEFTSRAGDNAVTMFHIQKFIDRPVNPDMVMKSLKPLSKTKDYGSFSMSKNTESMAIFLKGINGNWLYMVQPMTY